MAKADRIAEFKEFPPPAREGGGVSAVFQPNQRVKLNLSGLRWLP